jgi:ATP-dependent Zn protease
MRACRGDLAEAERYIRRLNVRVERSLGRNWKKLEALAEELLKARTLTYQECVKVFDRAEKRDRKSGSVGLGSGHGNKFK